MTNWKPKSPASGQHITSDYRVMTAVTFEFYTETAGLTVIILFPTPVQLRNEDGFEYMMLVHLFRKNGFEYETIKITVQLPG